MSDFRWLTTAILVLIGGASVDADSPPITKAAIPPPAKTGANRLRLTPEKVSYYLACRGVGIRKNSKGRVVEIVWPAFARFSSYFRYLPYLRHLQSLEASNVTISDEELESISKCTALRRLSLVSCTIGRGKKLQHLRNLKLEYLDLTYTSGLTASDMKVLVRFAEMKEFRRALATDAQITQIAKLPKLEVLHLTRTENVTPDGWRLLTKLPKLRSLNADKSRIRDDGLRAILEIPKLTQLSLRESGPLSREAIGLMAAGKARLQTLAITTNSRAVNNDTLGQFGRLKHLKHLELDGYAVTARGWKALKSARNLESLSLTSAQVSDEGVRAICDLKATTHLKFSVASFTDEGAKMLARLPRLKTLHMWFCKKVSRKGYTHLANCRSLEEVMIGRRSLPTDIVRTLSRLPKLKTAELYCQTPPTLECVRALAQLKSLSSLLLSVENKKAGLGDDSLAEIGKLTRLRRLHLGGCRMTDKGFRALGGLNRLEDFSLWPCDGITKKGWNHLVKCRALRSVKVPSKFGVNAAEAATVSGQLMAACFELGKGGRSPHKGSALEGRIATIAMSDFLTSAEKRKVLRQLRAAVFHAEEFTATRDGLKGTEFRIAPVDDIYRLAQKLTLGRVVVDVPNMTIRIQLPQRKKKKKK